MKTTMNWKGFAAATLAIAAGGARAQTGQLQDLGSLLESQSNLTTFYSLIQKYPNILLKLPSYQGVTILAPNNDAFDKIPYSSLKDSFANNDEDVITNVLEYHILQGTRLAASLTPGSSVFIPTLLTSPEYTNVTGGQVVQNVKQSGDVVVFVSGEGTRSTLTQADLAFNGGVVQAIDSLLIPPANLSDTLITFNLTAYEGALYTANQMATFTDQPNVTIFAPMNSAFQNLGPAISSMTSSELATVLDYMLLPQTIYSTGLTNGTKFLTQQGENISVLHDGNNIYINSAQLQQSDILIANGVLHMLDNVLNPQGPGAQPNPAIASQAPVFASASPVADLPFTSAIPCSTDCPVSTTESNSPSSTGDVGAATTGPSSTSTHKSTSTSHGGAAVARETGFGAAGLMVALGGAVLML